MSFCYQEYIDLKVSGHHDTSFETALANPAPVNQRYLYSRNMLELASFATGLHPATSCLNLQRYSSYTKVLRGPTFTNTRNFLPKNDGLTAVFVHECKCIEITMTSF